MNRFARYLFLCAFLLFTGGFMVNAQEFYTVQELDKAKAKAREKHLPIAWLSSHMEYLNGEFANEKEGSEAELTKLALSTLQGQAVVIFQNADPDLPYMPVTMINGIETKDEGNNLPDGAHYTAPKILYADPDLTTIFGCTTAPDLRAGREPAINLALLHVQNNPQARALINGTAKPTIAPPSGPPTTNSTAANSFATFTMISDFTPYLIYGAGAILLLILFVAWLAWRNRPEGDPSDPL